MELGETKDQGDIYFSLLKETPPAPLILGDGEELVTEDGTQILV